MYLLQCKSCPTTTVPTNTPKCFAATTSGGKPSRNDQRFTLARSKSLSAGGETSRCQNISFGYMRYISTSEKNNKLSIMTTGSCPPDETSLGVGQVQSYLQITTAWLGLTIPTPSGKQCQGRGSQDDDDYTSNIFILEAPLNRKTTMGNVMNPADQSMPAQTTVLKSQNFKICVINSGTIISCELLKSPHC